MVRGLSALRYLDLTSNRLTMLPESFGSLNNLEDLNISSNHLGLLPTSLKFI